MNSITLKNIEFRDIVFPALVLFIFFGLYSTYKGEASLLENKSITRGKLTEVSYGEGGSFDYRFYVNGILYEASDPDDAGWPDYVRTANPIINGFYNVAYDRKDPSNSKIIIDGFPKHESELLAYADTISAKVTKVFPVSDSYADLYIKYTFKRNEFSFRTRIHKDSLPCGSLGECKEATIALIVAKQYPEISNLYIQSYDRRAMRKDKLNKMQQY
ncbi:hypothetical protein I2486_13950 [Cellulophaga sp. E16_2]|uniref:Uncharacterized protein n=1 Tax=Cellulophaga algicola (strain DSM 14237 / IC166 / ACAM 630) TaxID=688270 RepID=E6XCX6_CELAD|nr:MULTISPECIES: hypothetical protein [Cellulophaga]ADV50117.1 hypothetical protein Celal_2838 [Cellulophaga algicola DSM 14237]MBO0592505.1 hypothetical protein [Cellulophaga sp. E16_2]